MTERKRVMLWCIDEYSEDEQGFQSEPLDDPNGNLVTSDIGGGLHMPVIDFDFPCQLVPSSTEGHFHLYIDKAIDWERAQALLKGLLDAGLIQRGWYDGCLDSGYMRVRHPDFPKDVDLFTALYGDVTPPEGGLW